MAENNTFSKKKIGTTNLNITAVNIYGKNLIIGDDKGNIIIYQLKKSEVKTLKEFKLDSKIEKICIPFDKKIAFILSDGDVFYINLKTLNNPKPIFDSNQIKFLYVNLEDKKYYNSILVIYKKSKLELKIYDFIIDDSGKLDIKEKDLAKEIFIKAPPDCGIWTEKCLFVFSINQKTFCWLNCELGKIIVEEEAVENAIEICDFDNKLAMSNNIFTLYMKEGNACALSMTAHPNADFHSFCKYQNFKVALYDNNITFYNEKVEALEPVTTINFDNGETGKYMVTTGSKLIILTSGKNNNINFIDIQDGFDEELKILLDNKLYNESMEKLVNYIPINDEDRQGEIENMFLDCALVCLENMSKDYPTSLKYLRLTNFNPFEFIYMFCDALDIKIIHKDKEEDIKNNKKQNQFFKSNEEPKEQKKAFEYLVSLLQIKRDYICDKLIKANSFDKNKEISFMSSSRAKINLKDSNTKITIGDTIEAITMCLLKCMIKLNSEPLEIEKIISNESLNYIKIENLDNEPFFSNEENKNIEQTKLIKCFIAEKYGDNYETAFKNWKDLGEDKNKKYSLIGKQRTKKLFFQLKEDKSIEIVDKERIFKFYIIWLLEKYPEDAFEIEKKTELVNAKVFMDEIIPLAKADNLKEKFLEYCNKIEKTELYETLLLELYIDKLFEITGKENKPEKLEGDAKRYYDLIMDLIKSEENIFNKKIIFDYINNSWFTEAKICIYAQLNEYNKAIEELFNQAIKTLDFKPLEEFCKNYTDKTELKLFEIFYKLLSIEVKKYQESIEKCKEKLKQLKNNPDNSGIEEIEKEININEELKKPLEKEMSELLKSYGSIDTIDPTLALELANDHLNICQNKEFFNYLKKIVKNFNTEGNKYKIAKNLSDMGLAYKAKEEYDLKQRYVKIDSDRTCDLCRKKIGSTIFAVYPNLKVYHSKCAPNSHIEPSTGVDLSKKIMID